MNVTINPKAIEVIKTLKNAVSNSLTGYTFCSIRKYTSKGSEETANHLINIGIDMNKAKQKDLILIENLDLTAHGFKSNLSDLEEAKAKIIQSLTKPNENMSNAQKNLYTHIVDGLKVNNETGELLVYGFFHSKKVLNEGKPKTTKHGAVTIARREIENLMSSTKYVQYTLDRANTLKANGDTIEL